MSDADLNGSGYIGSREFSRLLDYSTRTLTEKVKQGVIPPPDRPARKLGEGHKWKRSTVQRVLDDQSAA